MTLASEYDYVIVGAGSAGCVLARRLTEDPDVSVLLVEAGPVDHSLWIHMPAAFSKPLQGTRYNWAFKTEPEPGMDNRQIDCPRGKVLGGSSAINGMAYVRGHAYDYDRWAEETGDATWAYRHILPYFKKAEAYNAGGDRYRGADGPLNTTRGRPDNPLNAAFIAAGQEAGFPGTGDMNGYQQEGFGVMDRTTHKGRRWSTAMAYLRPAKGRANLTVSPRTQTLRVVTEQGRATGIAVARGRDTQIVHARREVILSAGAIGSPQLLQLSGIGGGDTLKRQGLDVVQELPGVGQNLQDHLEVYVQYSCTQPVSLYPVLKPWNQAVIGMRWLANQSGPGASNQFEAGAFTRTHGAEPHPNVQYHFLPLAIRYDGTTPSGGHGFQAHVGPMRPASTGWVSLRSPDPRTPPAIQFNYMTEERDRWEMREAIWQAREVINQPAFDAYRGHELNPGWAVQTDAALDAVIRHEAESAYHPAGTCAMGPDPAKGAVTDPTGRVHDVPGLRVVDASLMPSIVSANLNAPVIMMAEKLADVIRERALLPPEDAPVYATPATHRQPPQRSVRPGASDAAA